MTGKQLMALRKNKLKISRAQLAEEMHVTKDAVVQWEQGKRAIRGTVEVALEYVKLQHGTAEA